MGAFWVFLGGGLGAMARYGIGLLFATQPGEGRGFPTATFVANLVACVLLGYGLALVTRGRLSRPMQLLLLTGFCGGFSTFSTFAAEVWILLRDGAYGVALAYLFASLLLGVAGVGVTLYLLTLREG